MNPADGATSRDVGDDLEESSSREPAEIVEFTGTTQSAGQTTDEGRGRIFPCENCGADLQFHIGQQSLKCPFCGHEKQIAIADDAQIVEQDFHAMLERMREIQEEKKPAEGEHNEVRCEKCGANVVFTGPLTSTTCPYCDSPIQRENVHTAANRISVDGVLPFLVPRETAHSNLVEWVRSRWFAPNQFLKNGVNGKFSGVYLPYWTFDSLTATRYSGQRGDHYYVTVGSGKDRKTVRHTRWSSASGAFERFFDDVLVLAAKGMRADMMQELEPWPLPKCLPFTQQVLAGYFARTYEVELDTGFTDAKRRIDEAIATEVRQRIGGDEQRIDSINTQMGAITYKHLLLPTWLMSYRYYEKVYQVMINAATGEVQGERPYSWVKITFASVLGLIVVGIAVFFFSQQQ